MNSGPSENSPTFPLDEGVHLIEKPFSSPDLAKKIREILDKV